jgi:hypothetical protein
VVTPARKFSTVTLIPMKHTKTVKGSHIGVDDTGEKFLTCVNDISKACSASDINIDEALKSSNNYKIFEKMKSFLYMSIGTRSSLIEKPEVNNS